MRLRQKIGAAVSICGIVGLGSIAAAGAAGFVVNRTPSFPVGLYGPVRHEPRVGDLVSYCPPVRVARFAIPRGYLSAGSCSAGSVPLVKRLVAVAGDRYAIGPGGVWARGRRIANSAPFLHDGGGHPLPQLHQDGVIPAGDVLVMSDYSQISFDGRYFGPVERSGIQHVITPLWTVAS